MNLKKIILTTIIIFIAGSIGTFFFFTNVPWVNLSTLEYYNSGSPSIVLDDEGNELTRFQSEPKKFASLEDISPNIINAFLVSEDNKFFTHGGLSIKGIIRSLFKNIIQRKKAQGASTITQQLVRLIYFDHSKTFKRKIKEQFLALSVEKHFTKELILETYLNQIYLGHGIYGVETACKKFWEKNANDATISDGATLAGIIQSPTHYCPLNNLELAQEKRNKILKKMLRFKYITQEEYKKAINTKLNVQEITKNNFHDHIREQIRILVEERVTKQKLYNEGLTIQTTLNSKLQKTAEKILKNQIEKLNKKLNQNKQNPKNQEINNSLNSEKITEQTEYSPINVEGALISLDPKTGAIKTMVGGYSFSESQFNRAINAKRQTGSIIKPILYAKAIEFGLDLDHTEIDEPIAMNEGNQIWCPQNHNKKYEGKMTLAQALIRSKNTISVKLLNQIGIQQFIDYIKKFDLTKNVEPYPSIALGSFESTVLKAAGVYATLANKGIYNKPYLIDWIKDKAGKKIWKHNPESKQIINWKINSKIVNILISSFRRIFNYYKYFNPQKKFKNITAFSKTGTTNDSRTCWFAGSTPELTTVVYIGDDTNKSLGKNIYPVHTAFPIWIELYNQLEPTKENFKFDPKLKRIYINPKTGKPVNPKKKSPKILILK